MASTRIYRTAGTPTLNTKHTISMWFKRTKLTYGDCFLMDGYVDSSNRFKLAFDSTDSLELYNTHGGSYKYNVKTNRKFRDTSAFYHLVIRIDTTQSTASDRVRVYVNGTEEESFSTYTNATQDDANNVVNESGATISIGDYQGGGNAFDGLMTHVHFVDGTSYAPTTFGEFDSTSGIWKPKTAPSVTYGNNGFFLKFENSGNMDLDSSGNNLTFTTSGTLTQNVDTPSNNFATFNPLFDPSSSSISFNNGNLRVDQDTSGWGTGLSSLGVNTGKFYAEFKATSVASNGMTTGIVEEAYPNNLGFVGDTGSIGYHYNGTVYNRGSSSAFGNSYAQGDIIGVAMDLTNGYVYFSKNGTFQNSGVPTSGATGTGGISIGGTSGSIYFLGQSINASGYHGEANFGQGYFGTTAVASAGTAPSEGGIFEYDCPSGYQSLCTKGINSF